MNLRIKEMREAHGLSQSQLAKAIGKSPRTVTAWEIGESYPNAEAIWNMCELFRCDPNTFIGWYEKHPQPKEDQSALTPDESRTIAKYRRLTPGRQEAVNDMLDGLVAKSKASATGSGHVERGERVAV